MISRAWSLQHIAEARDATMDPSNNRIFFGVGLSARDSLFRPLPLDIFQEMEAIMMANTGTIVSECEAKGAEQGYKIGCVKGCSHCCFQQIEVAVPELIRIALWLRQDPAAAAQLQLRAGTIGRKVIGLSHHERYARAIPCPALKHKECSIYPVRPGACASYFSASRRACQTDWDRRRLDRTKGVPIMADIQNYQSAMMMGLHTAYWQAGFDVRVVELGAGLARVLATPDAPERWLKGEKLFEDVAPIMTHDYPAHLTRLLLEYEAETKNTPAR
jgi:Fe-S-cluster containining protein